MIKSLDAGEVGQIEKENDDEEKDCSKARGMLGALPVLLHRVKPNHISLGIEKKSDKTVLANGHLLFLDFSTILQGA
jgi:hypothetical protein